MITERLEINRVTPNDKEALQIFNEACEKEEEDGNVVGWVAISPTSSRCVYKGCVEMSIYVDQNYQSHGVGTALVKELLAQSEQEGFWSIYSAIISINKASIELHKKCGFREIGYRERIAKDRFGEWQNTTLMEYRAS